MWTLHAPQHPQIDKPAQALTMLPCKLNSETQLWNIFAGAEVKHTMQAASKTKAATLCVRRAIARCIGGSKFEAEGHKRIRSLENKIARLEYWEPIYKNEVTQDRKRHLQVSNTYSAEGLRACCNGDVFG